MSLKSLRDSLVERVTTQGRVLPKPMASITPIWVTGGMGDLIMALPVCEAINGILGDVVVYSRSPNIVKLFSFLPAGPEHILASKTPDCFIHVNSLVSFKKRHTFTGHTNQKLKELETKNDIFLNSDPMWKDVVQHHPNLDHMLGEISMSLGIKRHELPFRSIGLEPIFNPVDKTKFYPPKIPYITIHDGFDNFNGDFKERPTKNWDLGCWELLVAAFKSKYRHYRVFQLGGTSSRPIPGVDVNYMGCSIEESFNVLSGSALHIDGESGLVHAATRMGVKCIVMFGPTPSKFFGYDQNINIDPKFCGGCWWLEKTWLQKCVAGYTVPACMQSTSPSDVIEAIEASGI